MTKCVIPLFFGIGDVIQTLPFASAMTHRYDVVAAYIHGVDYRVAVKDVTRGVFSRIFPRKSAVPKSYKIFHRAVKGRSYPQYKAWFETNGEKMPKRFKIEKIGYRDVDMKHRTVIWPEGKKNWPCKKWPYWRELVGNLEDVAVVGIEASPEFPGATDYRGKLSFGQVGGLIRNADIFIGNEGGVSHYAAALGVKTYIIYGCTDPVKNMPPENAIRISRNLECQPCQFEGMKREGITMIGCETKKCLTGLSVDDVIKTCAGNHYL